MSAPPQYEEEKRKMISEKPIARFLKMIVLSAVIALLLCSCGISEQTQSTVKSSTSVETDDISSSSVSDEEEKYQYINPDGNTLETRINVPEGYTRTDEENGSLGEFLRNYAMKPDGSPVLLYDGSEKSGQNGHAAVFALPIENVDLQQCADSIMRIYAEYYRSIGEDNRIAFHFTNGFLASYSKWKQGYRVSAKGNNVSWVKTAAADDSDETFIKYLHTVFMYAGTASMETECNKIDLKDLRIGDVFLHAGSPGHVVMVVDTCWDSDGKAAFLLAQGYMPAQEFHVIKNPAHDDDPWYYEEEVTYSAKKDEYSIGNEILERPEY